MKPYGLVLAGGGGKGAYQIGAWKAMRELGITFNAVAGVSIGSINGALIVADDFEAATELWNNVSVNKGVRFDEPLPDPENLFSRKNWPTLFKEIIKNKGIDASPVKDFLSQYIDEKKVRKKNIPFGIVTVQMTDGINGLELFAEDIPEGQLIDYLLASSNIPLATKIGPDGEKFLDGGIYDNTPVSTLKKQGYNRLIVVDISTIKGVNHNLDFLNSEIVYIRPNNIDDLGASFDFAPEMVEKRMLMGYYDTMKAFSYLNGKIFYFLPETFRSLVKQYGPNALEQLEELGYELKLEKLKIYSGNEFISAVKTAYEEKKAQQKAEEEAELEHEIYLDEKDKKYSLFRRIIQKKSEFDFREAIAVLDNIIM